MPLKYPFNRQTDNGEGVVFNEETGILSGTDDPTVTNIETGSVTIPASTVYIRTGQTYPEIYVKQGTASTDWNLIYTPLLNDFQRTAVNAATYTILATDSFIGVQYTTIGAVTLALPDSSTIPVGKIITIKDEGGNARRNSVTINRSGTDTIEGNETSIVIKINEFSVDLQWTGNEWSIV